MIKRQTENVFERRHLISCEIMVSIIVPVYNISEYLPRCVDSLLDQTYKDIEIILVDDGSTDSSAHICDKYKALDQRVRVIHKKNGGLTSARNAGLSIATGEWILNVDGDDWIDADYIQKCLETAETNSSDIVLGYLEMIWQDGKSKCIAVERKSDCQFDLRDYIAQNWTCLSGSLIKKNLYDQNNLQSPEGISWHEDFYLIVRLCFFAQKVSFLEGSKYFYWQRCDSIMNGWSDKMVDDALFVLSSTCDFFKNHRADGRYHDVMGWRLMNVCQGFLMSCDFDRLESVLPRPYDYILSCPFVSKKRKALYWMFAHRLKGLLRFVLKIHK